MLLFHCFDIFCLGPYGFHNLKNVDRKLNLLYRASFKSPPARVPERLEKHGEATQTFKESHQNRVEES